MEPPTDTSLRAYETQTQQEMKIQPAPIDRSWMDQCHERFPYRCLPMVLANQAGWVIGSPTRFTVRWNGGPRTKDLRIWLPKGYPKGRVLSHFGYGIITITIPYLFRTPQEINLWVKGPSNWPKDAVQPLEGVVESDWSVATFTMNWKMTRPNHSVRFEKGEPICMLVPVPRGLVEQLRPQSLPLARNEELAAAYQAWRESRNAFNQALSRLDGDVIKQGWQKDYFLGRQTKEKRFNGHQTRLNVKEFEPG